MTIIGALLLTTGVYLGGVLLAKSFAEELLAVNGILELLDFMGLRISTLRTPLYDLFCDCANPYLESLGFLPLIRANRNQLQKQWAEAVEILPVNDNAKKELLLLGKDLGVLPLEEQQKRLEICINGLKKQKEEIALALPKKQKSVRTTALLAGAIISILLI